MSHSFTSEATIFGVDQFRIYKSFLGTIKYGVLTLVSTKISQFYDV